MRVQPCNPVWARRAVCGSNATGRGGLYGAGSRPPARRAGSICSSAQWPPPFLSMAGRRHCRRPAFRSLGVSCQREGAAQQAASQARREAKAALLPSGSRPHTRGASALQLCCQLWGRVQMAAPGCRRTRLCPLTGRSPWAGVARQEENRPHTGLSDRQ